jgi:fatty-acyl-CoA synthase/long-chain acyl-CoA synthetase
MLHNCHEYVEIYFALAKIGAVAVPLNFMFKGKGLEFLVNNSEARIMFLEEATLDQVESVRSRLISIAPGGFIMLGRTPARGYISYEGLIAAGKPVEPDVAVEEEDDVIILYTSGTTGLPKGIVLTHRTRLTYCQWCGLEYGMLFDGVHLVTTPMYHNVACFLSQTQFYTGGKVIVMRKFDAADCCRLIESEKVTSTFMVPTQLNLLLQLSSAEHLDLSTVRTLITGAAPLSTRTKEEIISLFNCDLHEMYGLTETGLITNMKPKDALRKVRCVGQPFFHMEMRVADGQGREVQEGEVGEIIARGPLLLRTYYKNERAYRDAMRDGWFFSGDLGRVDGEGFLHLVDRKKDMICSGGVNIYPMDVEEVLHSHPKIQESAVIGVPDDTWGESVLAMVVLRSGSSMTEEEVIRYCKDNMASYQAPKSVKFIEALPRNPSGKVLKRELREFFWRGRESKI